MRRLQKKPLNTTMIALTKALKTFFYCFVAFQALTTIVGLVSVGHEYVQHGHIDEFPKGSWLHDAGDSHRLHHFGKRNVLSDNSTTSTTLATTTTTSTTATLTATNQVPTTTAVATESTIAMTTIPIVEAFECVDEEDCPGGKRVSALTVLLLSIFVGTLGIGRCVAGYCCLGVLKGFTCGGCGIWWIVDIIFVATASLEHAQNGCCFKPI